MTTVIPSAIQLIRSNDQTYMIHLIIIAQQNITLLCDGKRRNIIVHISRSSPQITRFRRNLIYYWWNTRIHLNLSWQSQHTFDGNSNTYIVPSNTNKTKAYCTDRTLKQNKPERLAQRENIGTIQIYVRVIPVSILIRI